MLRQSQLRGHNHRAVAVVEIDHPVAPQRASAGAARLQERRRQQQPEAQATSADPHEDGIKPPGEGPRDPTHSPSAYECCISAIQEASLGFRIDVGKFTALHRHRELKALAAMPLVAQRWHEPGPPPLGARDSRGLTTVGAVEEAPMAIVAGFDVHRAQITFDALDQGTGEVKRGRIRGTPEAVREWARRFAGEEVHVAVEAGTGWLFVCEALAEVGAVPHLAEPVETSALRGK